MISLLILSIHAMHLIVQYELLFAHPLQRNPRVLRL